MTICSIVKNSINVWKRYQGIYTLHCYDPLSFLIPPKSYLSNYLSVCLSVYFHVVFGCHQYIQIKYTEQQSTLRFLGRYQQADSAPSAVMFSPDLLFLIHVPL